MVLTEAKINVDYDFGIKNMSGFNLGQLFAIKVDPKNCPKNCPLNWRKKCNFLIDMIHPFCVIIENIHEHFLLDDQTFDAISAKAESKKLSSFLLFKSGGKKKCHEFFWS